FLSYAQSDLGLVVHDGVIISRYGRTRAAIFPIGIDPQQFAQLAAKASTHPDVSRLRRSLNGEKLALGVDRLDYSKGLINRITAFDRMWTMQPALARTVSLLQIATPSRGAIEAYGNLQDELAKLVSDVNGRHGADHRDRALHALDRTAHALGSDDGETSRRHHPALVWRLRRRAAGDPSRQGCVRTADRGNAGTVSASLGQCRR